MKLSLILSSEMPEIDESVKECINSGQWLLFKSENVKHENAEVVFYLKTRSSIFELSKDGSILKEFEQKKENTSIDELFYFSDIPQPTSLSNMKLIA